MGSKLAGNHPLLTQNCTHVPTNSAAKCTYLSSSLHHTQHTTHHLLKSPWPLHHTRSANPPAAAVPVAARLTPQPTHHSTERPNCLSTGDGPLSTIVRDDRLAFATDTNPFHHPHKMGLRRSSVLPPPSFFDRDTSRALHRSPYRRPPSILWSGELPLNPRAIRSHPRA